MEITKKTILGSIGPIKDFYLGQLEGLIMRHIGNDIMVPQDKIEEVIWATNEYDYLQKTIQENYSYIRKHKNDAKKIANYLCGLNLLAHAYDTITDDRASLMREKFMVGSSDDFEYLCKCYKYYCFAYDYLWNRFLNDKDIRQDIKDDVYLLNN